MCGLSRARREKALGLRYDAGTAGRWFDGDAPIVFAPGNDPGVETVHDPADGFVDGIAPFRFDGGRMGFLIATAPSAEHFDELTLKTLAGLADQAKLAIAAAR
jgi:hypothetical protein